MNVKNYLIIIFAMCLLLLGGCTSTGGPSTSGATSSRAPMAHVNNQDIQQLLLAAEHSTEPRATELRLQAASVAIDHEDTRQADAILQMIGTIDSHQLRSRYLVLRARLAVLEDDPTTALQLLDTNRELQVPLTQVDQLEIGEIRAKAYYQARSYLASARERIFYDSMLPADERQKNHEEIYSTLMALPEATLEAQAEKAITSDLRGWLSLAAMTRRYENDPVRELAELNKWKTVWSAHPAARQMPASLEMLSKIVASQPKIIALLLPLQGDLGPYGRAIRDGILAAHYGLGHDTEVRIYDTSTQPIASVLQTAVSEGAELVIGPLERGRVTDLAHMQHLPVPVLALNRTLDGSANADLYQFGLAPEDEVVQVANEVYREGKRNALVIYPDGPWGERNFKAFEDRWKTLGGTIVDTAKYSAQRDYSDMIKDLLDVDQSDERAAQLRRMIGKQFEFTPRRRQDIDFVFLLADSVEARKINPTLAFFYADDLPVYATSHVYETSDSHINAIDLNGIRFCDIPWKLSHTDHLQSEIESLWPGSKGAMAPFYALGVDAYRLYPRLQQLKEIPGTRVYGETGTLQLGAGNVITRHLMWARFKDGEALSIPMVAARDDGEQ